MRFLQSYRGQTLESPVAYLMTVAKGVLATFYRESMREKRVLVVDSELVETDAKDGNGRDPAEQCATDMDLVRWLGQLPRTHRAVLTAYKLHGYTYVEAAARLGLSIQTVKKYMTQAKVQLRECRLSREVRQLETIKKATRERGRRIACCDE